MALEEEENDLFQLGYHSLEELKDADSDQIYIEHCLRKGYQEDECVLYAFRCAVVFANDPEPDPKNYRWWFFTNEKQKKISGLKAVSYNIGKLAGENKRVILSS